MMGCLSLSSTSVQLVTWRPPLPSRSVPQTVSFGSPYHPSQLTNHCVLFGAHVWMTLGRDFPLADWYVVSMCSWSRVFFCIAATPRAAQIQYLQRSNWDATQLFPAKYPTIVESRCAPLDATEIPEPQVLVQFALSLCDFILMYFRPILFTDSVNA